MATRERRSADRGSLPTSELAARCSGVVQIYPADSGEVTALRGIDADFPRGAVTVVVGPSGSGKSTLMRLLALREVPSAGVVEVDGVITGRASAHRLRRLRHHGVAVVQQRPTHNLFAQLTVAEHLEHVRRVRRVPTPPSGPDVLDEIGLGHRRHHHPRQLSGGEQQRLAVAMATVGAPTLVLADEPTAELDTGNAEIVVELLRRASARGSAVVINTHDPHVAAAADRLLTLRHGTLVSERTAGVTLGVIDSVGRIQLPAAALAHFPDRRAAVMVERDRVVLRPPADEATPDAGGATA